MSTPLNLPSLRSVTPSLGSGPTPPEGSRLEGRGTTSHGGPDLLGSLRRRPGPFYKLQRVPLSLVGFRLGSLPLSITLGKYFRLDSWVRCWCQARGDVSVRVVDNERYQMKGRKSLRTYTWSSWKEMCD